MRHGAEVLGGHHAARKRIVHDLLAKLTPELERPEEGALVERASIHSRKRLGRVGIRAHVGERLLKEVVLPDAEHEEVETLLDAPIYLPLPVVESPVFRLEPRKPAVREVPHAAVLESRLLVDVQPRQVDVPALRHHVAVPEPSASAASLKKVIDGIQHAAEV